MTNVKVEKTRIHHSDGSATDVIKKTKTTHTWFGDRVQVDVHQEHHTAEEVKAEAKANMIAGGVVLAGTVLLGIVSCFFGSDDD